MQDTNVLEPLENLQDATSRTRTVTVTERVVAKDGDKTVEREKQTDVFIRPLPFRRWLNALKHMNAILANLPEGDFDLTNEQQLVLWIARLLGEVPDEIIGVASLATDQPAEFFDRIELDEGIQIILAVVEVNKDFFVQKVLPLLSSTAPEVQSAIAETFGQTQ